MAAAIGMVATLLVLLGVQRARQLRSTARQQWLSDLSMALAITKTGVETWIQERRADALVAAQQAASAVALFDGAGARGAPVDSIDRSRRSLAATLGHVRRGYHYRGAWAIDAKGRVAATADSAVTLTAREREAALQATREGMELFLGPYLDSAMVVRGDVIAPVFRPTTAPGPGPSRAVGAIVLAFDPRDRLVPLALGDGEAARPVRSRFVARTAGGLLSFTWASGVRAAPDDVVIDSARDGPEPVLADTTGTFERRDGARQLGAVRRIGDGDWAVARAVRERDAYRAVRAQLRTDAMNVVALVGPSMTVTLPPL